MMETSFLTPDNFLLVDEWGLNLSDAQQNGQFGDLKLHHDLSNSAPTQDPVGGTMFEWSPSTANELDWMESSDLGSYLDILDGNQEKILPIESALEELSPTPPTDPVLFQSSEKEDLFAGPLDLLNNDNVQVDIFGGASPTQGDTKLWAASFEMGPAVATFDGLVSPPDSPVQVAPVIKLEEAPVEIVEPSWDESLEDGNTFDQFMNEDFFLSELAFSTATISDSSCVDLVDATQLISSPLSVDDVEDTLASPSFSSPSSPDNQGTSNSIIDTCPELYKVISTSSLSGSGKRFSPYERPKRTEKSNEAKSVSKSSRKRAPAEPVPEHIIVQQVNKKDRKKLQNKNAAIRYRMKKKEEAKGIKSEEETLEEINTDLKGKVEDLEREIKYMKNLMEEVYKAKGVIKSEKQ